MANINNITKKSFEESIDALLNAHSQNSNKGKLLKEWFENSFATSATVSHVKEDKQIGNRVAEQFKHRLPIVVFVCDEEVNRTTLINKVRENCYVELNTVLVMSSGTPHVYETLLSNEDNDFVNWAQSQLEISMIPLESLSDEAKLREQNFREYLVNVVGNKRENLDNSLAHLNRTFVKEILRQYTGKPFIYETTDTDVLDLVLTKVRKTKADQDGNRNSSSRISRYITFLKNNMKCSSVNGDLKNKPLQQIYYGAPGTGKSHATNDVTSKYPETVRTTFHPDSDYSTFVGAYKPTMTKVRKAVVIGQDEKEVKPLDCNSEWEEKIAYKFVKQAFLKAYVKAWKLFKETCVDGGELAPQFLVIEEINRGNCAQIFGDLFQLLDRKQDFSEYPVEADADICKALLEEATKDNPSFGTDGLQLTEDQKIYINSVYDGKPVAEKICKGEVLVLPPNLYIWATMNTSDQSLFPIDSAFKRRWEWKYMKIKQGYKKDEQGNIIIDADGKKVPLGWKIEVKDESEQVKLSQDWWAFIQKVNSIIASMTSSADKQLGYFFCKADKDGVISGETFVSKVIFYLWNDVFKDYGFEDASLFRYKMKEGEKEVEKDLTFPDFYDEDGENVNAERLVDFIQKVMDWQKPEENV